MLALLAATMLLGTGCAPEEARAKSNSPTPAGPSWDWEKYPAVSRMRVALLPCQLQPKSTITVMSPVAGLLRVYVHSPQINLPANYLWAEFEPEIFAQEEQALREQARSLEDVEEMQWELEYPRQKAKLLDQIEQAQRELQLLRLLSTNDTLATNIYNFGTNRSILRPEALAKAEESMRLLQRQLDFVQSTNVAALGFDAAAQRIELQRREADFKHRRRQSRFEMPFDGKLTLSIPYSEGVTNYPVNVAQELAVARDISSVRARVVIENIAWTGLSPEKLEAVVRSGGEIFRAKFAYQKIERVQNREESAYYFEFPPEKAQSVSRLIGANVTCELWMDLRVPARIVPKLAMM